MQTLIAVLAVAALAACSAPARLAAVLGSPGPAADRPAGAELYDFLVGRWDLTVLGHGEGGVDQESRGELFADYVLEGRAIQDVWITPPRGERDAPAELPVTGAFYGTTLRLYDPELGAWRIQWNDPVTNFHAQQIGRAEGADIVQLGELEDGSHLRWRFTEITPDSFHWLGEVSGDGGASWELVVEILARRHAASNQAASLAKALAQ